MKRMILTLAVAAGVLCGYQNAQATILAPNGTPGVAAPGVAVIAAPADVLADTGYVNYTLQNRAGDNVGTGTVREIVARDSSNALDLNHPTSALDFIYQVTLATGVDVAHLTASDFSRYIVDAYQTPLQTLPGAVTPFFLGIANSTTAENSFGNVSFDFAPPITVSPPTSPSFVLIIKTDAQSFKAGNIALQDGGNANVNGFAPSPEPASLVLLGSCFAGLCGMGLLRLRRKTVSVTAA
jgi:hypothetical protein